MHLQAQISDHCDHRSDSTSEESSTLTSVAAVSASADFSDRRFDFVYVPTSRGASTTLSSLFSLHPHLACLSKTDLDTLIEDERLDRAMAKLLSQQSIQPMSRLGLVQHAHIAGYSAPDYIAERLAQTTTRERFVHGVRDPLELVVSKLNHEMITKYLGAYNFSVVRPASLFSGQPVSLPSQGKPAARARRRFPCRHLPRLLRRPHSGGEGVGMGHAPTATTPSDLLTSPIGLDAWRAAHHFRVGSTYAKFFEEWVPVSLDHWNEHPGTLGEIFDQVGADITLLPEMQNISEGSRLHRCMVQNFVNLQVDGHTLFCTLGFAKRSAFSNTFNKVELFWLTGTPDDDLDEKARLAITVSTEQWELLPPEARKRVLASEQFRKFLTHTFIPLWFAQYREWVSFVRPFLVQDRSILISELRRNVGRDIFSFLNLHSRFTEEWPAVADAI